jgi:hypothetical protein
MKREVILIAFSICLVVPLNNFTCDGTSLETALQELNIADVADIYHTNQTNTIFENKTRCVVIYSAIDGNGNQLTNNGTTTSRSITFQFRFYPEGGVADFLCGIDNQGIKQIAIVL